MTSLITREIDDGSVSLTAAHEQEQQAPARPTKPSTSKRRGLKPGARVCHDSSRRGFIESQAKGGYWTVRFAAESRNIRVTDLKLLPSDAASFEPPQAPLCWEERQREERASASESLKRRLPISASTNERAEFPITFMTGTLGPAFAS